LTQEPAAKSSSPGGLTPAEIDAAVRGLTPEHIRDVAAALRRHLPRLPLQHSQSLSHKVGTHVYLKAESFMPTRTFKVRGALNRILNLSPAERAAGVISASAGNHGQGVAYGALLFGIPATVVVPERANQAKVDAMRRLGAKVISAGRNYNAAYDEAMRLHHLGHATYVHAFDDPDVVAGQGTVGLEIHEDEPELDTVMVPIGGGGLISGVAAYLKQVKPSIRVIGVQPRGAPSMRLSLDAGEPVVVSAVRTIADGLATMRPGDLTFALVQRYVDDVVLVGEEEILRAIRVLFEWEHVLAEPAGAAALAGLLHRYNPGHGERVAVVISGANVTTETLERALATR
jgi:threonine dehydratase